jgi:hypothetical protein
MNLLGVRNCSNEEMAEKKMLELNFFLKEDMIYLFWFFGG